MNETSEDFRKITMKVLVMQLASTTIMDLVAYGGAGLGIAMAILSVIFWDLVAYRSTVPHSRCGGFLPCRCVPLARRSMLL